MSLNTTTILGSCLLLFSQIPAAVSVVPFPARLTSSPNNPIIGGPPLGTSQFGESLLKDPKIQARATSSQIYTPEVLDLEAHARVCATEGIDCREKPVIAAGQSIIVMEDKDGDGKADSSNVLIKDEGLRATPLGIAAFDSRILVSAALSIIIYADWNLNAVFDPGVDTAKSLSPAFLASRSCLTRCRRRIDAQPFGSRPGSSDGAEGCPMNFRQS